MKATCVNGHQFEYQESDVKSHFLMCGDSTDFGSVSELMNGVKADMVFTDPPYNIGFNYESWDDKFTPEEYKKWCSSWFDILKQISTGNIIMTIGHANLGMWHLIEAPLAIGAWVKKNAVTGSKIAKTSIWEPLLFYGDYKKQKRNFDVFEYNLTRQEIGATGKEHSCPKQIALIADIIKSYSSAKSIWLDIFGGSGTTLIACEQLDRTCYMMELDPRYTDVIRKRYAKLKDPENWEEKWQTMTPKM